MLQLGSLIIVTLISFAAWSFDHSYANYKKVLKQHVVQFGATTRVSYSNLRKDPTELNSFIKEIESVSKADYTGWSDKQKLAFLFNSYNALTLKLIIQELDKDKDLKSIKKIGGLFGNPWTIKFFTFLGKSSFLDEIEQDIARKNFDEPRLHFAFNCASIGCPALQTTAFTADKLDEQLDQATKMFLSDSSRNSVSKKSQKIQLSSIIKWYKDDFENSKKFGPLKKFLLNYFPFDADDKRNFENDKLEIKYLDYDWNLNKA